ncbi:hypothetical protein [Methanolapillus africanus]|uniref:hypothetical protein n=1 Tax=Methanolapillus africanus TaxID=3028297 RepID=UPI0030B86A4C
MDEEVFGFPYPEIDNIIRHGSKKDTGCCRFVDKKFCETSHKREDIPFFKPNVKQLYYK